MTDTTNAANNGIPTEETDPKALFDTYASTDNPAGGFYPNGIDANNGPIFEPITDNTYATTLDTGSRIPDSSLTNNPRESDRCCVSNPEPDRNHSPSYF